MEWVLDHLGKLAGRIQGLTHVTAVPWRMTTILTPIFLLSLCFWNSRQVLAIPFPGPQPTRPTVVAVADLPVPTVPPKERAEVWKRQKPVELCGYINGDPSKSISALTT